MGSEVVEFGVISVLVTVPVVVANSRLYDPPGVSAFKYIALLVRSGIANIDELASNLGTKSLIIFEILLF